MTIKHTLDVDADVIICNFQDIMIIKVEPKCQEIWKSASVISNISDDKYVHESNVIYLQKCFLCQLINKLMKEMLSIFKTISKVCFLDESGN